jgi:hypothetical protein
LFYDLYQQITFTDGLAQICITALFDLCFILFQNLCRKGPRVRNDLSDEGEAWTIYYALFSRAGFTEAAAAEMQARDGLLVDLQMLEQGLSA